MDVTEPTVITTTDKPKTNSKGQKQCNFYMEKKKRYCRVGVLRNYDFCAEHALNQEQNEEFKRVKCPYDGSHTCFEKMLEDHLKRCNNRPREEPPYFEQGLNSDEKLIEELNMRLADLETDELQHLIDLIQDVHKRILPAIPENFGIHPAVASEMLRTDIGDSVMKHLAQNSALLYNLEPLLEKSDSTCFLELGSGKGGLTFWLVKAWDAPSNIFVLLDRSSHRHKKDNKLKDSGTRIERIRIDIEHLKLDKLPPVVDSSNIVGVCKHLCGSATDMALKCLLGTNTSHEKVKALAMATCCHHRCTWEGYVGKTYMEKWGISRRYFKCLTGIAGWAVCGTGRTKFEDSSAGVEEVIGNPKYAALNLNTEARRKIGVQVKELLDYGRVCYVQSFGLSANLVHYVDTVTTLENVAIIGKLV